MIAYDSWRTIRRLAPGASLDEQGVHSGDPLGVPRVRIRRLRKSREQLLEPGSMSPSWRSDGALAYVVSASPAYRANRRYLTQVKVRAAPRARPVAWSDRDAYTVLAWAGTHLIVLRKIPAEPSELVVFDGPHSSRTLVRGAGLIAVSPSGTRVLISAGPNASNAALELLDVSSGALVATLQMDALQDGEEPAVEWIKGPGAWVGERIILTTSTGLAVLTADGQTLATTALFRSPVAATRSLAGLLEPRFLNTSGTRVFAWQTLGGTSDNPRRGAHYSCDLESRTCERHVYPARAVPRPVFDLSGG